MNRQLLCRWLDRRFPLPPAKKHTVVIPGVPKRKLATCGAAICSNAFQSRTLKWSVTSVTFGEHLPGTVHASAMIHITHRNLTYNVSPPDGPGPGAGAHAGNPREYKLAVRATEGVFPCLSGLSSRTTAVAPASTASVLACVPVPAAPSSPRAARRAAQS